jgi:hypothetical protein
MHDSAISQSAAVFLHGHTTTVDSIRMYADAFRVHETGEEEER